MVSIKESHLHAVAPFIAPLVAVVLAYLFYIGLFCSDDTRYLIGVHKIVSGEYIDLHSMAERRLIFLHPGAGAYAITGNHDGAIAVYALFAVSLPVLAWFGARRFGVSAALLASLLTALAPVIYMYAGAMLPDILGASVVAAQMVQVMSILHDDLIPRRRLRIFVVGFLAMLGVAIKESNEVAAILAPGFLAINSFHRDRWKSAVRDLASFAGGCVMMLLVELLLYRAFSGQWHVGLMNGAGDHDMARFMEIQGVYPWTRLAFLALNLDQGTLAIFLSASIAVGYLAVRALMGRSSIPLWQWVVPATFFFWQLLYFTIGTITFSAYIPPVIQPRYYATCVVPAAVLVSMALMVGRRQTALWRHPIAGLLCSFLLWCAVRAFPERGIAYWSSAKEAIQMALIDARVADPGQLVVVSDGTVNTEVERCLRLIVMDGETRRWTDSDSKDIEAPFFLLGDTLDTLVSDESEVGRRIQAHALDGQWEVGIVGYYFSGRKAPLPAWWLPRQMAIRRAYLQNRKAFHQQERPRGAVSWERDEMHSELYLVYPRSTYPAWND